MIIFSANSSGLTAYGVQLVIDYNDHTLIVPRNYHASPVAGMLPDVADNQRRIVYLSIHNQHNDQSFLQDPSNV